MKNRYILPFIALIGASSLTLTGCFSGLIPGGNSSGESGSGGKEGEPTLSITETDEFKYDEEQKQYTLDIYHNHDYQIQYSLGDYSGTQYSVVFDNSSEKLDISATGLVHVTEEADDTDFAYFYIKLMKQGKSSPIVRHTVWVNIKTTEEDLKNKVYFTFKAGDMLYDKDYSNSNWFFNLAKGNTFLINPILPISGTTAKFSVSESGSAYVDVLENGQVTAKDIDEEKTAYIYIDIYNSKDRIIKSDSIRCIVNGDRQGDNMNYPDARISIENGLYGSIEVVNMSAFYKWDYEFKAPFQNLKYKLPEVGLNGYDGEYEAEYLADSKDINIFYEDGEAYFSTAVTNYYNLFSVIAKVKETGEVIDRRLIRINITRTGKSHLAMMNLYTGEYYEDGDEVDLLINSKLVLTPMFNYATKAWNGESVIDNDNCQISQALLDLTVTAKSVGKSTITFTVTNKDIKGTQYDYEFTLKINVLHRELIRIYAGNPDAIRINGNSVAINGKIYAEYTGDYYEVINNKDGLSYVISDVDATHKKITFTYVDPSGASASVEYTIDLTKEYGFSKRELTKTYYDYNKYSAISSPLSGDIKFLVIPVWFNNSEDFFSPTLKDAKGKTQKEQVLEDLETLVFDNGKNTDFLSIKEYYEQESNYTMTISGDVADEWCEIDHSSKEYLYHGQSGVVASTRQITDLALDWYMKKYNKTFHDFDSNDDGIIDNLMIYYGSHYVGNPQSEYEIRQAGRAYVATTSRYAGKDYCRYSFMSCFNMYNLKSSVTNVVEVSKGIADLSSRALNPVTSLHETGHLFGLKDLYDTVIDSEIFPAGGATMQDLEIGGHDPYSLMSLGWAKPYIFDSSDTTLDDEITITINDLQSSGDLVLLTPRWNENDTPFDEYILVDLFSPTGVNAKHFSQYNAGIRIFHINATLDTNGVHKYSNSSESVSAGDNKVMNLVHYIRNNVNSAYGRDASRFTNETMFYAGDTFTIEKYKTQFLNQPTMDNGEYLGWSVLVESIVNNGNGTYSATLKLTNTK